MTKGLRALRRLNCSSALSAATWAVAFAPSVTTAVLHDRNLFGGSVLAWLVAAVVGALAAGAILLASHLLLGHRHPTPVLLAVFLLAGCARGIGVGTTAMGLGLVADPQIAGRALSGAILALFWLSVATIIVDGFRRHRVARLELESMQRDAETANEQAARELADLRTRTHLEVTARIRAMVHSWSQRLSRPNAIEPDTILQGALELHELSADVVRPLSHEMAVEPPLTVRSGWTPSRLRTMVMIVSDAVAVDPFRPGWVALLLFPSILTTAVRAYGWVLGLVGALWIVAMAAGVLWLARRYLTPRLRRMPRAWCGVATLGVWLASGAAAAIPVAWSATWGVGPSRSWAVFGIPLLAYLPITCLGVAIVGALAQSWAIDADARRARIADLEWRTKGLQQGIWAERKRLGRFLHGSVQSSLTSTALFLETELARGEPPAILAATAVTRLEDLLLVVDGQDSQTTPAVDIDTVLQSIATVWTRLAEVVIEIDPRVRDVCLGDADAAEHVVEIVREAIANAIRHGRASWVSAALTRADGPAIEITVRDDGTLPTTLTRGLGSAALDEICIRWERLRVADITELTCVVPVAAGRFAAPSPHERQVSSSG